MLRHPFLKLLSPIIGSVRTTTNQHSRSYQLTSRSGARSKGLHSGLETGARDDLEDLKRESEERIIRANGGQVGLVDGRNSPDGIMVKQEFSVITSEHQNGHSDAKYKGNQLDRNRTGGAESLNEDKNSSKSTFVYV